MHSNNYTQNMAGINADHILDIDRKLAELTPIPSERCIFRVHDVLRNENKKAYEPEVVAIGPYHHGKDNLKLMEEHKLRYLKQLLNRRNETSAERYIMAMRESEQKARKSYADPISLDSNKFVEMMLLDSCFIVELLRKNGTKKNPIAANDPTNPVVNLEDPNDPMTNPVDPNNLIGPMTNPVEPIDPETNLAGPNDPIDPTTNLVDQNDPMTNPVDLNALIDPITNPVEPIDPAANLVDPNNPINPATNLVDPNNLITTPVDPNGMTDPMTTPVDRDGYIQNAIVRDLVLFENQLPFFIVKKLFDMTITENSTDSLDNLIGEFFMLFGWTTRAPGKFLQDHLSINHLLGLFHYFCCYEFHSRVSSPSNPDEIKEDSLKSATELREAGIKFKKIKGETLFDIRFEKGTLKIPTLEVEDDTESVFRNLIAYEQYYPETSWHHFTAYHNFMDYLVNTSKDVEILIDCGIIRSFLGENEVVATMLNKLGNNIIISDLGYEEVYNEVNEHCRGKWNTRFATLRRDYFNTPWAFISFLAAVVLLLLTVLQTIFTIHPFGKSN
ncbi:hypothetical protein HYC85_029404 [Camellia sinensis]|uniref:Uncharacterized protein n=1 Tax=Camellia sinensis TaxID=4442 RepID=A0A7J7FXW6_CAMSI|nr:hypothetical protein HYC85_029404 [Camellia sinensis]